MKHRHGDARIWVLITFVALAGPALYHLIPQHRFASGALTAGVIALIVLAHFGLVAAFGARSIGFLRARLLSHLRRPESGE